MNKLHTISSVDEKGVDKKTLEYSKRSLWLYVCLSVIIGIINVLFLEDPLVSMTVVFAESAVLICLLLARKFSMFYSLLIIFTSLSIESEIFAGTNDFYNFKNTKLLGLNLVIWSVAAFVLFAVIGNEKKKKTIRWEAKRFIKRFCVLCISGVVTGLLGIVFNDNNIRAIPSYFSEFLAVFYNMAFFPIIYIFMSYYCYTREPSQFYRIKYSIISVFAGSAAQAIFSIATNHRISIAGLEGIGIALSLIYFLLPFSVCFVFYKYKASKCFNFTYLMSVIAGIGIILINNANGKVIISLLLLPLFLIGITETKKKVVMIGAMILLLIVMIVYFSNYDIGSNFLLNTKLDEVKDLFNIFESDWLRNMPASPRYRITEFINIFMEYLDKPWYIIMGKGYLGSITDHIGMFIRVGGDFSDVQWENGTFYMLHESLNLLFLNNGLLGLFFWGYVLKFCMKNYKKSFFALLGGIWFCLIYGYSVTITIVGMTALMVGLLDNNYAK